MREGKHIAVWCAWTKASMRKNCKGDRKLKKYTAPKKGVTITKFIKSARENSRKKFETIPEKYELKVKVKTSLSPSKITEIIHIISKSIQL